MKVYKTTRGILAELDSGFYLLREKWDAFVMDDELPRKLTKYVEGHHPIENADFLLKNELVAPISSQEIWASGVTYMRSKEARMHEAEEAGGGDFYDRVYDADRPELFFKATPHRTVGHRQAVRIRKDSKWNVPEPELTLMISPSGKIIGYTCGNDMSSRDIEGENPLYLPQAKTYDQSAAIGPGVLVAEQPLPENTAITLEIKRAGKTAFTDSIAISQIKRKFEDLVEYLYRETTFPNGCFLMTGTGIVPPNEFTLEQGDEIHISIDHIGTLINHVA